jgi:hypothetical protein
VVYPAGGLSRRWVALRYNTLVTDTHQQIDLLRLLASRLERLSVDSHWARRASGLRGNILKIVELAEAGEAISVKRLDLLVDAAFNILRRAAQDIPDLEALVRKK